MAGAPADEGQALNPAIGLKEFHRPVTNAQAEARAPNRGSGLAVGAVLEGSIAGRVYEAAVAAFPRDLALRVQCLQALCRVALQGSRHLQQRILGDLATNFASCEAAWDLRARHAAVHATLSVYAIAACLFAVGSKC